MITNKTVVRLIYKILTSCSLHLKICSNLDFVCLVMIYLLFAVPFQHSSPGAILSPAHTVSGNVDQNFFACFSFFFTSFVCIVDTEKKQNKNKVRHRSLKQSRSSLVVLWVYLFLTNRSKLVPAAVVGLASGLYGRKRPEKLVSLTERVERKAMLGFG